VLVLRAEQVQHFGACVTASEWGGIGGRVCHGGEFSKK
jgi:hypothetical protein